MSNAAKLRKSDQARDVLNRIGDILIENDLDITPENYTVAHQYVAGNDSAYTETFDRAIREHGGLNSTAIMSIRAQTLPHVSMADLSRMTAMAEDNLGRVADLINQSGNNAKDFHSALSAHDGTDLSALLLLTKEMIKRTQEVEEQMKAAGEEMKELRSTLAEAKENASKDALTGLPNRRALDEALRETHSRAKRQKTNFAVAICDIDHFKSFNDQFGHDVGDIVIKWVAEKLTQTSGKTFIGRFGGEEFVLIFEGMTAAQAQVKLNALRNEHFTKELKIRTTGQSLGKLTFSAGVSNFPEVTTVSALLKKADEALYRAKDEGRNRVCLAKI